MFSVFLLRKGHRHARRKRGQKTSREEETRGKVEDRKLRYREIVDDSLKMNKILIELDVKDATAQRVIL